MAVTPITVVRFGEILNVYYASDRGLQAEELNELASMCNVGLPIPTANPWDSAFWTQLSRHLLEGLDQGNNRILIDALLEQAGLKNAAAIGNTTFERQEIHNQLREVIREVRESLGAPAIPSELSVAEGQKFTAKAEVREFFQKAAGSIFVVDPYVGVGTLDCVRGVDVPIRLLTGTNNNSIEEGFDRSLADFASEDFSVEVRRHGKLHDRHVVFNDRCWLIGSSLKDAGKKQFNVIEMKDTARVVIDVLERKWEEAEPFP